MHIIKRLCKRNELHFHAHVPHVALKVLHKLKAIDCVIAAFRFWGNILQVIHCINDTFKCWDAWCKMSRFQSHENATQTDSYSGNKYCWSYSVPMIRWNERLDARCKMSRFQSPKKATKTERYGNESFWNRLFWGNAYCRSCTVWLTRCIIDTLKCWEACCKICRVKQSSHWPDG